MIFLFKWQGFFLAFAAILTLAYLGYEKIAFLACFAVVIAIWLEPIMGSFNKKVS